MNRRLLHIAYLSFCASTSCQVVTGLDGLQVVDAGESSSSSSIRGTVDAGSTDAATGSESGGSGGKSAVDAGCRKPPSAACDLPTACGCKSDQHCQARGPGYAPACVTPGPLDPGSLCQTPADCPRGQTCDDHTCRAYCRDDVDCGSGICVALQTKDTKARGIRVCWAQCSPDEPGSCGPSVPCRMLQNERGESNTYCAAPSDPCPTTEDGTCDDSRGTGQCADATDSKDCECAPSLPDAHCDPIAQCGCPKGQACAITPAGDELSAMCRAWSGPNQADAPCEADAECAPGYACQLGGSCSRLCNDDSQCGGGSCLPIVLSRESSPGLHACYTACDRMNPNCPAGQRCAHFDARFAISGDYCVTPLKQCPAADGVCDEARGSGLCADDTDVVDCCQSSLPGGACDLVKQCGCEKKPGTSCVEGKLGEIARTSLCLPAGPTAANEWCLDDSSCARGLSCFGHVCRPYCDDDASCGEGGRCIFAMRNDVATSVRVCLGPCDPETNAPCGDNTRCTSGTVQDALGNGCTFEPLTTTCPTNNGRCDEPKGTGICAVGSDSAECSAG